MSDRSLFVERRMADREYFPTPTGDVILWISIEQWIPGFSLDSAPGGLAVAVESEWQFRFEEQFQVRVAYRNTRRLADVTSVIPLDDGRYRIGLKWVDLW